jgi:hypothetical protein
MNAIDIDQLNLPKGLTDWEQLVDFLIADI